MRSISKRKSLGLAVAAGTAGLCVATATHAQTIGNWIGPATGNGNSGATNIWSNASLWNSTGAAPFPNGAGDTVQHEVGTGSSDPNRILRNTTTDVTVGKIRFYGSSTFSTAATFQITPASSLIIKLNQPGPDPVLIINEVTTPNLHTQGLFLNAPANGTGHFVLEDDLLIRNTSTSTRTGGSIGIRGSLRGSGNITVENISNDIALGAIAFSNDESSGVAPGFAGDIFINKGAVTISRGDVFTPVSTKTVTIGAAGQGDVTLGWVGGSLGAIENNFVAAANTGGTTLFVSNATSAGDVNITSTFANAASITLNGDMTFENRATNGSVLVVGDPILGAGALTKIGAGPMKVTNANTYQGGTTVNAGTLVVANNSGSGTGTGAITIGSAGSLGIGDGGANGAVSTANAVTNNGNLIVNRNDVVAQSAIVGVINGTGSFTKAGIGTLTLDTANGYTGTTTVNAGTLTVTDAAGMGGTTGMLAVNNPTVGAGTNVVLNLPTTAATTKGSLSGAIATPNTGTNTATINNGGQLLSINQTADATFAGVIAGSGGFTLGSGSTNTLTLSGLNTYTGDTTVQAGTLAVTQGIKNNAALNVADGAKAVIPGAAPNTYDGGANIPSGNDATGSLISSLNLNATGQLDLGNSDMAIDHDGSLSIATIAALVASGYNGGTWDGPGIIASSANLDPTVFGLGYAENGDPEAIPDPYNDTDRPFFGIPVDSTSVLLKFTWLGDLNVDGFVNFSDLVVFNGEFDDGATTGRFWYEGDFDYDGDVDFSDLVIFNGAYDENKASMPEPAAASVLALAFVSFVRRRRTAPPAA